MFCDKKWANSIVKIDTREGIKKYKNNNIFLTQTVKNCIQERFIAKLCLFRNHERHGLFKYQFRQLASLEDEIQYFPQY